MECAQKKINMININPLKKDLLRNEVIVKKI